MRLLDFKPLVKNTLRGFADVELGIGLQLSELSIHVTNGKPWVGMPSKPMLGADGLQIINVNGKKAYKPMMGWRNKALSEAFSKAVVKLVLEQHPNALDGGDR
jgi:hypothetical protein